MATNSIRVDLSWADMTVSDEALKCLGCNAEIVLVHNLRLTVAGETIGNLPFCRTCRHNPKLHPEIKLGFSGSSN